MQFPIERIELYHVRMPLRSPWVTAYGSDEAIDSVLVRLTSGSAYGWGEATPLRFPTYSPEWGTGVFMVVRDVLSPVIIGEEISSGQDLQRRFSSIKGNQFAKAALDLAWWDLYAKTQGQPLWQIVGGCRDKVEVGADFGVLDDLDVLLDSVGRALRKGFKRVKLKYRTGWGLEMIRAVRKAFPQATLHIDCNAAFTLDDLPMFRELDKYKLAMIEQPLAHDDLIDHAELQRQISTPICLDESITSVQKARQAVQIKACKWINIKPGRVGGFTNALEIHDLCRRAAVPCWVGGMLESALGVSSLTALATLDNIKYPSDICASDRFYVNDLSRPRICISDFAMVPLSTSPGVGAEPDSDELKRLTVDTAVLEI